MENVSKLKLLCNLANAQYIQVVVNSGIFASALTPMATTFPSSAPSRIPTIEVFASAPEVGQLVNAAPTLTTEESTPPLVSTKRSWDEEQQTPRTRAYPK